MCHPILTFLKINFVLFSILILATIKEDISNKIKDHELKNIAQKLPDILKQARSDSTNKSYESGFRKWQNWGSKFTEVKEIPAEDTYVTLFMSSLIQSGTLFPTIKSVFYAIKHFHQLAGESDLCYSEICINIFEAAKRVCSSPKLRKEPLTSQQLKKIYEIIGVGNASPANLRNFTIMLIAFKGFMRLSEI